MNWYTSFRLKVRNFFKKNKNILIIGVAVFGIIIAINYFLKNMNKIELPSTTYEPHTSVMQDDKVPEKLREPIQNVISQYVEYCNEKQYEKAYDLLDDACKDYLFPNIEKFQKYVDKVFNNKKIYNIQNFSNIGKTYVYKIRILNDILASGLNDEQYLFYEEVVSIKEESDNLKLGIYGFIKEESMSTFVEDDYIKVSVNNRITNYETEVYEVTIKNKSNYVMVLMDNTESIEVEIDIGAQTRKMLNTEGNTIVMQPNETITTSLAFTKFVDDGRTTGKLKFNNIRILPFYSGKTENKQAEMDQAIKLYSLTMEL